MAFTRKVIPSVPVFALEGYALLPFTVAAFQVFEPAHREMIDDCEATDRLLAVAGLRPDRGGGDPLSAPVHAIAGLGKLVNVRRGRDESREVYVHGIARVRLLRVHRVTPYPLAQAERVDDSTGRQDRHRLRATLRRFHDYLNGALRAGQLAKGISRVIGGADDPAVLSYRLGAILLDDPAAKQALLEERSPVARLDTLIEAVAARLLGDTEQLAEAGGGSSPLN